MAIKDKHNTITKNASIFEIIARNDIAQLLSMLKYGTNVNIRDSLSRTPLMHAICVGREESRVMVVRALIKKGANVNAQDNSCRTSLMYACGLLGREDAIGEILKARHFDPNIQDLNGNTAIMHAVLAGNASALRQIVSGHVQTTKADPNRRNSKGYTPLSLAVKLQQADCCRVLVNEAHANILLVPDQVNLKRLLMDGYVKSWITQNQNEVGYRLPCTKTRNSKTNSEIDAFRTPEQSMTHFDTSNAETKNKSANRTAKRTPVQQSDAVEPKVEVHNHCYNRLASSKDCTRLNEVNRTIRTVVYSPISVSEKTRSKEDTYKLIRSLFKSRITFAGGLTSSTKASPMLLVTGGHSKCNKETQTSFHSTSPLKLPSIS